MSKCRKCKAELPEDSRYCNMCGAKITTERKPKARGNGTGSVYKRGSSWTACVVLGFETDADGKIHRLTRSKSGFRTKKEALEYIPTLKQAPSKQKSATFAEMYSAWLPTHRAGKDTINCYKAAYKYFAAVHNMQIAEIDIDDLQECLDDCPRGRRTKENMKALCGLIYKYAIPRHYVSLDLGHYLIVSGETGRKEALPDYALERLSDCAGDVFGADYVLCQCYLGFRAAELVALDVSNYDRTERAFVGGAKTEAGTNRVVTVSPKIQNYIDRLTDKPCGAVFADPEGKPYTAARYRELFYDVLRECGIDNPIAERDGKNFYTYTPHSCRHTFATLMKRVEGSDKDKLELIGHTSTEMLRHYQGVSIKDLRKITDAL